MAQKPAKRRVGTNGERGARLGWRKRLDVVLHELSPREFTPQRVLLIVIAVLGFTVVLSTDIFRQGISWQPGQKASRTVVADRTVTWLDDTATEQLRRAEVDRIDLVTDQALVEPLLSFFRRRARYLRQGV